MHQHPGTLLQAKRLGVGPAPSPLRQPRHLLKHERPQPTGCSWVQQRPLTPMHPEQPGVGPPVWSSPIPHQPRMKRSSRFVPWQSLPVTAQFTHFLVKKLEKGLIVAQEVC